MAGRHVRKGVVLAAGDGDRMGTLTSKIPKVLIPVLGKPLILYPIEALVRAGIREIAIVTGYLSDRVRTAFGTDPSWDVDLQFIFNPNHHGGNAISVATAGDWLAGEPFVLCMGDHLMHQEYVSWFLDKVTCQETLGVDFKPGDHHVVEEATKVHVNSRGSIRDIGKQLVRWDGVDTGVFLLTDNFICTVRELSVKRGINVEISEVIRFMLTRGQDFLTCDTTGPFWADIDTKQDVKMVGGAERWLKERWL